MYNRLKDLVVEYTSQNHLVENPKPGEEINFEDLWAKYHYLIEQLIPEITQADLGECIWIESERKVVPLQLHYFGEGGTPPPSIKDHKELKNKKGRLLFSESVK